MKNSRTQTNNSYFQEIDTPIKAYILGVLMADGYIDQCQGKQPRVCLEQSDEYAVALLKSELKAPQSISVRKRSDKSRKLYSIKVTSSQLVSDLIKYGITTNKSGNEVIPNIPFINYWIRGFYDGDGTYGCYFSKKSKNIKIACLSTSESFANSVKDLLHSNGIESYVWRQARANYTTVYWVYIQSYVDCYKFIKWTEGSLGFPRKQKIRDKILRQCRGKV